MFFLGVMCQYIAKKCYDNKQVLPNIENVICSKDTCGKYARVHQARTYASWAYIFQVLPRGLELLPTELAAKTCRNTGSGRIWKAETVLEKQYLVCFLILPDEFIDNRIDNPAIAKNCQKRPRAAGGPTHPLNNILRCNATRCSTE